MTKKLEELFNLPDSKDMHPSTPVVKKIDPVEIASLEQSFKEVQKITKTLPVIQELNDLSEQELDNLAKKAEDAYDDLMDLGMNVEVRYASRIFEVASSMLNNAIGARTAKIDKKLKAVDLQLKKLKIDNDNKSNDPNDVINGQGYIITDRNDLLKKLGQKG
jgi:Rad3-related DNA helicase